MKITKDLSQTGVCAKKITVIISPEGLIQGVSVVGGCDGQGKALNALLAGQSVQWAVERLRGIHCGKRNTSCADQIAQELESILQEEDL